MEDSFGLGDFLCVRVLLLSPITKSFEMFGLLRQGPPKVVQSELIWGLGPPSYLRLIFHWDD